MEVLELKILHKEAGYIYYRISYEAQAVLSFLNRTKELPIDFTIETSASGAKDIELKLKDDVDYPLLPVIRAIKEKILEMDKKGLLPC
ncbi:hypothetical protein H0R92_11235 [Treponema sp. OMZ 840]|uniref:hypothetical protein n=1 Tax=Treponema sp. OMZ 840 TaxID=244313 RepID=UPI003D933848